MPRIIGGLEAPEQFAERGATSRHSGDRLAARNPEQVGGFSAENLRGEKGEVAHRRPRLVAPRDRDLLDDLQEPGMVGDDVLGGKRLRGDLQARCASETNP